MTGQTSKSMMGAHFLRGIQAVAFLAIGSCAAGDALARSPSAPFPDRNPLRTEAAPAKQTEKSEPSGPLARVPELLEYPLSKQDADRVREAIRAIYARRFGDARSAMARIKDKTARKLTQWYYYRRSENDADPNAIETFRKANPDWPSERRLQRNAETSLLIGKSDAKAVFAFFGESLPTTGAGKVALAAAYLETGEKKRAQHLLQSAWRKHDLGKDLEEIVLKRFGKLLSKRDHKARVDRLLLLDRKSRIASVERTAALLDKTEQKKIKARIAVVRRLKSAKKLLADVSDEEAKDDIGFYFSRIQWLRRHDQEQEAWKLLLAAPKEPKELIAIDEWWIERRVNCRKALNSGHPEIAYQIAHNHGPISGGHYREAKFLSGWIALRFINKPAEAWEHFLALRTAATDSDEISEAEYWLGRTAAALGKGKDALTHYQQAAEYPLTYYGQLAAQSVNPGPKKLDLPPTPKPTQKDFDTFKSRDAVQAIALARSVDLEKLAPLFFYQLARTITSPGEIMLLTEMAQALDQPYASVRLSKIALNRGLPLADLAYPTHMLPEYKEINVPVENALLYALSRQESEFNPVARSPVGARGLMQIMPRTARAIARQHKVRYRSADLTRNPSYNVMLGAAHLGDLLNDYGGSYILTLVAYNAGPGRVRDWTEEFGNPTSKNGDPIDWVERIPFTETRNYVKKILSGVQIFRSRLEGADGSLRLVEDLNRGKPSQ